MDARVENWLNSARYDLAAARDMLAAGRFVYTVFFAHLAVEKALKARVQEQTGRTPPRIHDLIVLLKRARLDPPSELRDFLGKLAGSSTATRYPADLEEVVRAYPREVAEAYLRQAEEAVEWIARQLKP
ncbi:HEPN domain-containing protein [Candidatus Bipolaricaulota bacterium]|nr:HEPN domain-containing protein [Candidatus Bipolaricaulota bacterium]